MTTALILILTLLWLFMTYRCYKLEKENKRLKVIELLKEIEKYNVSIEEVLQLIRSKPLVKKWPGYNSSYEKYS